MQNIRQIFSVIVLLLMTHTVHAYHSANDQKNWKDLLNEVQGEENEQKISKKILNKYNKKVVLLFDISALTDEQLKIVNGMRKNCYNAVIALKDLDISNGHAVSEMLRENADCFALWAENKAAIRTKKRLSEGRMCSPEIVNRVTKAVYNHVYHLALSKKKGCLNFIVDGRLDQFIDKEIESELQK